MRRNGKKLKKQEEIRRVGTKLEETGRTGQKQEKMEKN